MGRLVRKPQQPDADLEINALDDIFVPEVGASQAVKSKQRDGYLERMVKYVPAEIIAFSMIVNAIFDQAVKNGGPDAMMAGLPLTIIAWAALLVALVLTPTLCWYLRKDGDAWIVNAVMSTVAFPFWAYLMGAVEFADFHDGNLAAILVLTFTAVSGLVMPSSRTAKRREAQAPTNERPRLVETGSVLRDRITELFAAEARGRQT